MANTVIDKIFLENPDGTKTSYSLGAAAENVIYSNDINVKSKIDEINSSILEHEEGIINTEAGLHGLRYYAEVLQAYDSNAEEQRTITTTVDPSYSIGAVTGQNVAYDKGKISITQSDPSDTVVEGVVVAEQKGTVVIKTVGVPASSVDDENAQEKQVFTERDIHSSTPLEDTEILMDTTYYYSFFPYTINQDGTKKYNLDSGSRSVTPTKTPVTIPTPVNYSYVYQEGVTITPTWNYYDANIMSKRGQTSGSQVGTYTVTFTLLNNFYKQADGDTSLSKAVDWYIVQEKLKSKPVITSSSSFSYNGNSQYPITSYDPDDEDKIVLPPSGTRSAIDVGQYEIIYSLKDKVNYCWSDGTKNDVVLSQEITPLQSITLPTVANCTYTGSSQTPVISYPEITIGGVTTSSEYYLDATGDLSGTNAKNDYQITFTPNSNNVRQVDNSTEAKSVFWAIEKAESPVTMNTADTTLNENNLTITKVIENIGSAGIEITQSMFSLSSNSIVKIKSFDGESGQIVFEPVGNRINGTTIVTLNIPSTTNYNSKQITFNIICDFESYVKIVSWTSGTDAEIKAMLEAYYNDYLTQEDMGQAVGDTRLGHFNAMQAPNPNSSDTQVAQDITLVIVDYEHTDLATPINGHTKACITVQTRECMSGTGAGTAGTIYVNGDNSYVTSFTKQSNLYMRTYLNSTVLNAIPEGDFKSAIKESSHYRHTTYNGTESEQVIDTLFLPSYPEIFSTVYHGSYAATNPTEGTQFKYYEISTNRVKYINNNGSSSGSQASQAQGSTSTYYNSDSGYRWCIVDTSGKAGTTVGTDARGLAPVFAM